MLALTRTLPPLLLTPQLSRPLSVHWQQQSSNKKETEAAQQLLLLSPPPAPQNPHTVPSLAAPITHNTLPPHHSQNLDFTPFRAFPPTPPSAKLTSPLPLAAALLGLSPSLGAHVPIDNPFKVPAALGALVAHRNTASAKHAVPESSSRRKSSKAAKLSGPDTSGGSGSGGIVPEAALPQSASGSDDAILNGAADNAKSSSGPSSVPRIKKILDFDDKERENFAPKPCNCKKSKCRKEYCDCFKDGFICSPLVRCVVLRAALDRLTHSRVLTLLPRFSLRPFPTVPMLQL